MSKYLTLSGSGAVSLFSPESASLNPSSVIGSLFDPASAQGFVQPFPNCFTGISEVGDNGVRGVALHLAVELPEVRESLLRVS